MENNSSFIDIQQPDLIFGISTKITLFSVLLSWSLVGNVLVIAVVYWNRDMRTNFNYLIVNMAVSDLLIPLIAIPIKISQLVVGYEEWLVGGQLGNILCKLCFFLTDISAVVSVVSLVIIAVNRYFAVSYPVHQQLSRRVVNRILLSVTWIVAMCLFSPYLITFGTLEEDGHIRCKNKWFDVIQGDNSFVIFVAIVVVISFVIPAICIIIIYPLIIYKLNENSRNISLMLHQRQLGSRKRRNKQITYISLLIVIAFICLWGPFYVFLCLFQILWKWQDVPPDVHAKSEFISFVVTYIAYLNSCINPCIYFFCLKNYRQGLRYLLCRIRPRRKKNSQSFETFSNRPGSSRLRKKNSTHNHQSTSILMVSAV